MFHGFIQVGISLDETVTRTDLKDLLWIFGVAESLNEVADSFARTTDAKTCLEGTSFERSEGF